LPHCARRGGDRGPGGRRARRPARSAGRGAGDAAAVARRGRPLRRRVGAGPRRARGDLPARRAAEVGAARAAPGGHDPRGGLHPDRGRRGDGGSAGGGDTGRAGGERMRIWPIYKKELRLYFTSPVAWVLLTIFLLIAGYFFYAIFAFFTPASMQS